MIGISELPVSLANASPAQLVRFRGFLATHCEQSASRNGLEIPYCVCGQGPRTILALVAGWGGIETVYETILAFEERNRMVIVDISAFDDPDEMSHGINMVLDEAGVDRVVLMGQSLSGVLAQLYFRRNPDRVDAVLLTNTLAPKRERCRKWTRLLLAWIPFPVLRVLLRRKMRRLGHFDKEIPAAVEERRRFAGELMASQVDRCFTRERISRILKLGWCFNEEGEYSASELCDWRGPALLITSTDRRTRAEDPFIQLPCASRRSSPPRAEPWSPR